MSQFSTQYQHAAEAALRQRIRALGRGQSFDVDTLSADGSIQKGTARVTLAGQDGSCGGYIELKGTNVRYYYSGTTIDGQYVPPHRVHADGSISSDMTGVPRLHISDHEVINKMLGLEQGRRRGFLGTYTLQKDARAGLSVFYSGEPHHAGIQLGPQTFAGGEWRRDGSHGVLHADAVLRLPTRPTPSAAEQTAKLARLKGEQKAADAELARLEKEKKEVDSKLQIKQAEYQRLKTDWPAARLAVLKQEGSSSVPDELRTTVQFTVLDRQGYPVPGKDVTAVVTGARIYVDSFTVNFKDELIQSGEVTGHPHFFRRIYGSSQTPASGTPIEKPDTKPGAITAAEEKFLRTYSARPAEQKASWDEFWSFAENTQALAKYRKDRESFWTQFWRVANFDAFWALSNDPKRMALLDLRSAGGSSFSIVEGFAPGYQYDIRRRNLGGLEPSLPKKFSVPGMLTSRD